MSWKIRFQLWLMMFLEYFVWGAWYVTVGNYMTAIGLSDIIYLAYLAGPIGAIVAPFFLGMIADRFFPTERVLSSLHIVGGVAMFLAPFLARQNATLFIIFLLIHNLCYMPTIALTNSLSFHHMTNQEKEFPVIRVLGTIGWIIAGLFVSGVLHADETAIPLYVAGVSAVLLGLYCQTLPHTPPPSKGEEVSAREILGLDAIAQLGTRSFWVFIISSFLITIPLSAYYSYGPVFANAAGVSDPAALFTLGQVVEAVVILTIPFFFAWLGVKRILLLGMAAWVLRYGFFAGAAPGGVFWMIVVGILLHGVCYDMFFISGQIYVDKISGKAIRGQAQGFLTLATYGLGMFFGFLVSGWLFNNIVTGQVMEAMRQWQWFWIIPGAFAILVMIFFGTLFRDTVSESGEEAAGTPAAT
ncbi:MAG TPA: MFS transporter [bacterium]|nr:MFS transporter [bacterium]